VHNLVAAASGVAHRVWLPVAILVHAALAIGYLVTVPAFNWPDEPAHLNYVLELADGRGLPVMTPDAWAPEPLEQLKRDHFDGVGPRDPRIVAITYEAHQPPLYYLVAALLFHLTGSLTAVRLLNLLLSCAVVAITPHFVRAVFPDDRWIAPTATFLVALHPMRCAMAVSIGNDPAVELVWAGLLLAMATRLRPLWIGVVIGIGILAKVGFLLAIPLYGAWLWIVGPRTGWLRSATTASAVALLVAAPWIVRNVVLYGWTDPFAVAAGALGFDHPRPHLVLRGEHGIAIFLWRCFQSWWGTFGWMEMLPDPRALVVYVTLSAAAASGLVAWFVRLRQPATDWSRADRAVLWSVAAHAILLLALVAYSRYDFQAQGRYLLVLAPASATLLAFGFRELIGRWWPLAALAGGLALLWVNLLNLRHVIPWYLAR
jgi:hypothetical protein